MAVELILLDNVDSLGKIGDKIRVADGYARNFLLPRKLAAPVSKQALQQIEAKKLQMQKKYEENIGAAKDLAKRIADTSVTIAMEATEEEKLYGSVTSQHIADALKKESEIEIDRHCILIEEPIRELGVFNVPVRLVPEVETTLKVWVVKL